MNSTTEMIAKIRQIDQENPHTFEGLKPIYEQNPGLFESGVLELLEGDDDDRDLGLQVALGVRVPLPESLVSKLLSNDSTRERTAFYINFLRRVEFVPRMNEILAGPKCPGRASVMQALINLGDKRSEEVLAKVYDKMIKGNPSRRARYQALQAMWAVSELPQILHPLPEKTTGIYLRKGGEGTPFPISNVHVPTCECCQKPMVCLFRIPKEADPLEMPVFHCPSCNFDSPIFLDLKASPPQWIGACVGESVNSDDYESVSGGTIAWGVDIQGAESSKTFIGGKPDWAQEDEEFECPTCGERMEFVIQMETDYTLGAGLYFLHGGIMYVHRCRECQVACYFFQTS